MSTESHIQEPSKTVLIITVGFLIMHVIIKQAVFLHIALFVGVLGSLSSLIAVKIDWVWTKISWILSLIVPRIIMTLIFFLVLTPIAFLSRVFGKSDPMDLKNSQSTLFKKKEITFSKESFEKPW
jgi:hypothetical protein